MEISVECLAGILADFGVTGPVTDSRVLVDIDEKSGDERTVKKYVRVCTAAESCIVKILRLPMCPVPFWQGQARFSELYRNEGIPTPRRYALQRKSCSCREKRPAQSPDEESHRKIPDSYVEHLQLEDTDFYVMAEEDAGEQISDFSESTAVFMGQLLGKMHRISEKYQCRFRPGSLYAEFKGGRTDYSALWRRTGTSFLPKELLCQVLELYQFRIERLRGKWELLPRFTVQGDVYRMNLTEKDGQIRIIDYDRAGDEILLADLIVSWFRFRYDPVICTALEEIKFDRLFQEFLKAYQTQRQFTPMELEALEDVYAVFGAVYGTRMLADMAAAGKIKQASRGFGEILQIIRAKNIRKAACENIPQSGMRGFGENGL